MSAPTRAADTSGTRPARTGLVMVAALLGLFITLLDVTVVNVALPAIEADTAATFSDLQWVANAYLISLGVFIVAAGRLGDVFGLRPVYLSGVTAFLVGSVVCGTASSVHVGGLSQITVLHVGRVVQGLGGAVIIPLTLAIIYSTFEGKLRALGIVLWGAVGGLATALGPLIGGLLVEHASWHWVFFVNLPLGAVVLVATVLAVASRSDRPRGEHLGLDVPGLLTISAALLCLNLAIINGNDWGWSSVRVLGLFAGTVAAGVAFFLVQRYSTRPMLDLRWFRSPVLAGALAAGLFVGIGLFAIVFYLSLYLQQGLGISAQGTGVRLLPLTGTLLLGAPIGGRLVRTLGKARTLAVGLVAMSVGIALLSWTDDGGDPGTWVRLVPGMLLTGLTMGIVVPVLAELTVDSAPEGQVGVAASIGTMMRQVGNAIGVAIIGALVTTGGAGAARPGRSAGSELALLTSRGAWFAAGVTVLAAVVVVSVVVRRSPRPRPTRVGLLDKPGIGETERDEPMPVGATGKAMTAP